MALIGLLVDWTFPEEGISELEGISSEETSKMQI